MIATTETTATVREKTKLSPRQKGIRQGIVLMALSVILIPAYFLLAALFPANDRLVESAVSDTPFEKISQAILLTLFLAGLARLLYARFFQTGETPQPDAAQLDERSSLKYALPAAQATPVPGFGGWRVNTDELVGTASVTEHTTKSLDEK
ncbi:MAG TPA: hypothetical protein VJT71_18025 [Pyrinomonadaceae bacterium]|nr:hypothetical protein [Pyrinomonadaceae bacterium]